MRLGWARFSAWAREAVFIADCILGMRKSNPMNRKLDTISDEYGSSKTLYLQVLRGKGLYKMFSGDGVSPATPVAVMY